MPKTTDSYKKIEGLLNFYKSNSYQSEIYFLNQLNKLDFTVAIFNDQLDILFSNPAFNQLISGLKTQNITNLSQIHKSHHILDYLKLKGKKEYSFELIAVDGKHFGNYILKPNHIVFNNSSYHILFESVSIDQQFKEELNYKNLLEQIGIGIGLYSLEGKIITFNNIAAAHMGGKPRDFEGKTLSDLFSPEAALVYQKRFQECIDSDQTISFVDEVSLPTGIKWFKSIYDKVYSNNNELIGVQIISDDITSSIKSEKTIEDEKKKLGSLLNNINSGFALHEIILDENGKPKDYKFLSVNKTYEKLTQLKASKIIGKRVKDEFPNLDQKWIDLFGEVALKGEPKHIIDHSEYLNKYWDIKVYSPAKNQFAVVLNDITEQKRSEIIIDRFFEQSNVIHVVTSLDGVILKANKGWESILGYRADQLIGKKILEFIHTDDIEMTYKEMESLGKGKTTFHFENRYKHINGEYRTLVWSSNIDENEQLIFGIAKDISEEKNILEKLKSSEEKFKAFVNNATDGVAILDENAKVSFVNKSFCQLIELEEKELLAQNAWDLIYKMSAMPDKNENYRQEIKHQIQNLLISKEEIELKKFRNTVIQKSSGEKIDISESVFVFATSKGNNIGVFIRDISDLKRAEREIQSAYELLSETEKIAKSGSWTSNPKTNEGSWSKGSYAIRGASINIQGNKKNHERFMHPEDIEPYRKQFEKNINSKETEFKQYYRLIDIKGKTKHIEAHYEVQRNEKGEAIFITGIDKDVTELINAQNELIIAKEKAEESDQLKSAFLANMSHEIRTPMNGILGFAELLKDPELEKGELEQYVDVIERSGKRMLNIINDLIDISKIEARQMDLVLQDTNINEQIKYLYTFFKPETDIKNITLNTYIPPKQKETCIYSDREKIYAVLTNLVKNAIKHTQKGKIEFGYLVKDTELEFFVIDTGDGIPKDKQESIFERFVQADMEHNRKYEGAGLGLSISKAYVEMLGGRIWINSSNDQGSDIRFSLPLN